MTLKAVPAGTLVPGRFTMPDWSRGRGQTKNSPGPLGWGLGGGPITRPLKTKWITETFNIRTGVRYKLQ